MPLRCLLFSSNEETVQPIWQVLTDLGIEGEYCKTAVDAVERVTTQQFQIVITDWDDQPEAAFLLKTARELKAAQRPLTLAIVSDNARLPEALQAGANSVLVKPLRAEQVRDTMSTACELLRAKLQIGAPSTAPREAAIAAAAGAASAPASVLPSVAQAPEALRAGDFLQSASPAPGAQFDTEKEVHKSQEQTVAEAVDALTELAPMAASVETPAAPEPEPHEPLTGWAALQARLTKAAPPAEDAPAKSELLSYGETPSRGAPAAPAEADNAPAKKESQPESRSEAALFAYVSGEPSEDLEPAPQPRSKFGKILLAGTLAACVALAAVPRTRQSLGVFYRNTVRAGSRWLNPAPAPVPQVVAQHDSFGQEGDEYKLPTPGNIPDATTDPSQIRVVPVVDPTAKPDKNAEANAAQAQAATANTNPGDANQNDPSQAATNQAAPNQTTPNQAGSGPGGPAPNGQSQPADNPVKDPTPASVGDIPAAPAPSAAPAVAPVQGNTSVSQPIVPQPRPVTPPAQSSASQPSESTNIPSSLKSQMASMTPESSGNKPAEAAMSSIEPVTLPETAAWGLLAQPVDPVYPDAARAGGQKGSVVLQVLIGRDGAVQDAKFLQGSLVFARSAIEAVKQWRFKPYSMNGRAVSVQSVITLNFKPPA